MTRGSEVVFDLETGSADELFRYVSHDDTGFVRLAGALGPNGADSSPAVPRIVPVSQLIDELKSADRITGHNSSSFDLPALAWHHGADYEFLAAKSCDTELVARQVWPPRSRDTAHTQDSYDLTSVAERCGVEGKGHPHGTGILTPQGFVSVEDLVPGDMVIGSNGLPVQVLNTYRRGVLSVYRVTFDDRTSILADGDHLWTAAPYYGQHGVKFRDISTLELMTLLSASSDRKPRWAIPLVSAPVKMVRRKLPIDPYILGVLLGDGALTQAVRFTPGDLLVPAEVERRLPPNLVLASYRYGKRLPEYRISRADGKRGSLPNGWRFVNPIKESLKEMGLWGKRAEGKFIPDNYLYSSANQRLDLLRGLMDTDGELYRTQDGVYRGGLNTRFSSASENLTDQVRFLVESFGGTARKSIKQAPKYTYRGETRTGQPSYKLTINIPINPFLTRSGWEPNGHKIPKRIINSIELEGQAEVTCLYVDAVDSLYVTEHCIVTHNSDSAMRLKRKHGGWDKIPLDDPEYRSYLEGDLRATAAVAGRIGGYLDADPYLRREHQLAAIAGRMSLNGFRVDTRLLTERLEAGENRKREALDLLHAGWGLPLTRKVMRGRGSKKTESEETVDSPLSGNAGREWLARIWERYQVSDPPLTAKGKLSIGTDDLNKIAVRPECPGDLKAALKLMEIVTKTRSVYGTASDCLCPDGRVHPVNSFRQASGRWSVTNPGLTVFGKHDGKHHERDIFLPDEGHILMSFDLAQVDMRAIAGHCQDPAYMALFGFGPDGKPNDAHKENAAKIGISRQATKAISHGWNYGLGAKRMIANGLDPEKVYAFIAGMEANYPQLIAWREDIRARGKAGEILDNGFGRRMMCDPDRAYTVAPALLGQGGARDIMGEALLRLPREILPMLRVMVHDEILVSCLKRDALEVAREVQRAMTFMWRDVPIISDMTAGMSWGECSAK